MQLQERKRVTGLLDESSALDAAFMHNAALTGSQAYSTRRADLVKELERDPFAPDVIDEERPAGRTVAEWMAIAEHFAATRQPPVPVS